MKLFRQYTHLEIKRMLLSLPKLLLGGLLLLALLAGLFGFCQLNQNHSREKNAVSVAIVAAENEPFIDWMITTVSNMKNTKYVCNFERMNEADANQSLKTGETDIIFLIPEQYIASIISGENKHVTIRFGKGQTNIINFLFRQLCEAASSFILSSEAGIYSLQEYYAYHQLPQAKEDELELNLQYIKEIVDLDNAVQVNEIEGHASYPLTSQYMISGFVLLLLLQGLSYSRLLIPQNQTIQKLLHAEGLGYGRQLLAKASAFFFVSLIPYLLLFLLLNIFICYGGAFPTTALPVNTLEIWRLAFCCLPILIVSTALILLVYEITEEPLGGLLFLTLGTLLMGLCSGCFYPLQQLPQTLQHLAHILPVYHLCQYGLAILHHSFAPHSLAVLSLYFILCYFIIVAKKSYIHRFRT